jgi:hypothetical protein
MTVEADQDQYHDRAIKVPTSKLEFVKIVEAPRPSYLYTTCRRLPTDTATVRWFRLIGARGGASVQSAVVPVQRHIYVTEFVKVLNVKGNAEVQSRGLGKTVEVSGRHYMARPLLEASVQLETLRQEVPSRRRELAMVLRQVRKQAVLR